MDENMYDALKTAITTDLLVSRDIKVSQIRVKIIEDRKYNIPDWFYSYITDDDINQLIINHCKFTKTMDDNFIAFLKTLIEKGLIRNYKYLVTTIIQFGNLEGFYDIVYLFDPNKMYKYFNLFVNDISNLDIIDMITSFTSRDMMVPLPYIKLYLSKTVSRFWYFHPEKVNEKLEELLDVMEPSELGCIYPVLYNSYLFNMNKSKYTYEYYMSRGGTWCREVHYDPEEIYQYIALYGMYENRREKMMDIRIKEVLFDEEKRTKMFEHFEEEELQKMIFLNCLACIDNIEFIYWDISEEYLDGLRLFFNVNADKMPKNLDKIIHLLFESNGINYTGIVEFLMRFIILGDDIRKIIPYLKYIATPEHIGEMLNYMSTDDIITIAEINPKISDISDVTFVDLVCDNTSKMYAATLLKVQRAFSENSTIYESLYSEEKFNLYMKNRDIYEVASVFPGILISDDSINKVDVTEMYKKNQKIISYVNPILLKDTVLYNHIDSEGYTPLRNIEEIGIEYLLNLTQIFRLLDKGIGFGYLLDFKNIGYINICIMYLLYIGDKQNS